MKMPITEKQSEMTARVSNRRLAREWNTVTSMIQIYCRDQHGAGLCPDCQDLTRYVRARLDHCRFGPEKPTCAKCPVHCYQRERRDTIKSVMCYAGPRMMWEHPWLSFRHLLDGWFRRAPALVQALHKATPPQLGKDSAPVLWP
jgi:hypothetical protein